MRSLFSIAVALAVIAAFAFLNSPLFDIQTLHWEGLHYTSAGELEYFSEFKPGNVFRVDIRRITEAAGTHPWIETVDYQWDWPNQYRLTVREREPVAALTAGGVWLWVDKDGALLPRASGQTMPSLPIITGIALDDTAMLAAAAGMVAQLAPASEYIISQWDHQLEAFILNNGVVVQIGDMTDMNRKMNILRVILEQVRTEEKPVKSIDLRLPSTPVVTFEL